MGQIWIKMPAVLAEAETMPGRLLGFDLQFIQDVLIMAVNIFILFFVLSYLLFNPVRDVLRRRRERIAADVESARKDKEDAQALKKDYEARLADADREVEEILSAARRKALRQEEEIIARAKKEAADTMARAHTEIELEKQKAVSDMKQEIISVAALMAEKIVSASIDEKVEDSLVDEALREIGEQTWQSR